MHSFLGRVQLFMGLDLSCGSRSHGENGLATQNGLGIVLPLWLGRYNFKKVLQKAVEVWRIYTQMDVL